MTKQRSIAAASLVAALTLGVAACGSSSSSTSSSSSGATVSTITGAGSTLVLPLVSKWEADYASRTDPSVAIAYGGIGSGGGIDQITAGTVDFGASDAPLTPDQASACSGCLQVPWALSATAIAYNVSGVANGLHLTPQLVADIYLGKVTTWNDPAIAKLNPGAKLPPTKITPIYRSDGSGDTYALTDLLAKISPEWKSKVGTSTLVKFPTGTGAEHNDGVAAALGQTDGGIAYLGAAYVASNSLTEVALQNEAGNYEEPTVKTIAAAAATVKSVPADNAISITDPAASATGAYPLSTFTYAIVPQSSSKADALKKFLTYAIGKQGQSFGPDLDFAALPSQVLAADKSTIAKIGG